MNPLKLKSGFEIFRLEYQEKYETTRILAATSINLAPQNKHAQQESRRNLVSILLLYLTVPIVF